MNKDTKILALAIVLSGLISGLVMGNLLKNPAPTEKLGSVSQSHEYFSTTTNASTITKEIYLTSTTGDIYATIQGALGSVILTSPKPSSGGSITLYDATTTVASRRAASMTSNTIMLTSIPVSNVTGTYVFDEVYRYGLIAVIDGAIPTSTITWR